MKSNLWVMIMAGGSGERLWPLSRRSRPKQTLTLGYKKSLLQATAQRLKPLVPVRRMVVVTTRPQAAVIRRQLPEILPAHFLVEPAARNTAAAIALGTAAILREDPEAVILVLPADHVISPDSKFHAVVRKAAAVAVKKEGLVCLGIAPSYPATGYGYIEPKGSKVSPGAYRVKRFIEKPNLARARKLIQKKGIAWNGGIFCWKGRVVMDEIRRHLPALAGLRNGKQLKAIYRKLPSVSIDVGVMERARNVWMIPADFEWNDIGSWSSVGALHLCDAAGNLALGAHLGIETSGTVIITDESHLVATIGVKDLIVVRTPDATLVCHKDHAQSVKKIVAALAAHPHRRKLL